MPYPHALLLSCLFDCINNIFILGDIAIVENQVKNVKRLYIFTQFLDYGSVGPHICELAASPVEYLSALLDFSITDKSYASIQANHSRKMKRTYCLLWGGPCYGIKWLAQIELKTG